MPINLDANNVVRFKFVELYTRFCSKFQIQIDQLAEHELPERNKFRQTNTILSLYTYICSPSLLDLFFVLILISISILAYMAWFSLFSVSLMVLCTGNRKIIPRTTTMNNNNPFDVRWTSSFFLSFSFPLPFLIGRSLSRILINNSNFRFISFEFIYHVGKCGSHYYVNLLEFQFSIWRFFFFLLLSCIHLRVVTTIHNFLAWNITSWVINANDKTMRTKMHGVWTTFRQYFCFHMTILDSPSSFFLVSNTKICVCSANMSRTSNIIFFFILRNGWEKKTVPHTDTQRPMSTDNENKYEWKQQRNKLKKNKKYVEKV